MEDKGTVCVTGGTGFVASWLIKRLLEHGYSVRATVRMDPERKKDISYLTNLPRASEKLQIFNADLNQPESFNAAIEGCTGVFQVAHPIIVDDKEPEEVVTKQAVEGTLGILKACVNSKTVKRVVYTSSPAAILYNDKNLSVMDEGTWSDVELCRRSNFITTSYLVSKTLAERAALEFGENHGLEVVSLLITLVNGPFLNPTIPSSINLALAMVFGNKDWYEHLNNSHMVHVDDAASAHIFLLEYPNAKGRYICSAAEMPVDKLAEILSARYPEYKIPNRDDLKDIVSKRKFSLSTKKLSDTGFKFKYTLEEMYDGAIQCCKEKGFL